MVKSLSYLTIVSTNISKLTSLLFVIARRMREEMKATMKKSGCSWLHFEVLRYVNEKGKVLMRDIAAHFSITPPAATLLVDGMVVNKLLRRIIDLRDRRVVRIALAPKGKKILTQGIARRTKKIKEIFSALDVKESAEFIKILEKIASRHQSRRLSQH